MKLKRCLHVFLCVGFLVIHLKGHCNHDSLWTVYNQTQDPEVKAATLIQLGRHWMREQPEKALDYLARAEVVIKENKLEDRLFLDCKLRTADAYKVLRDKKKELEQLELAAEVAKKIKSKNLTMIHGMLTTGYRDVGRFEDADKAAHAMIYYAERDPNLPNRLNAYSVMGSIFRKKNMYDSSITIYSKALDIAKKEGLYEHMGGLEFNLGNLTMEMEDPRPAKEHYLRAKEYFDKEGNEMQRAGVLIALGSYTMIVDSNYTKAIDYFEQYAEFARKFDRPRALYNAYASLGKAYRFMGDYNQSLHYHELSRKYIKVVGKINDVLESCRDIAQVHSDLGNNGKAIEYLEECLDTLQSLNDFGQFERHYEILYKVHAKAGNTEQALKYVQLMIAYQDSLEQQINKDRFMELQTQFESKQKELQIDLLEQQNQLEKAETKELRSQRLIIFGGLGLVGALVIVLSISYAGKRSANKDLAAKNDIINEQNQKIVESIGYAKQIQQSISPTQEEFSAVFPVNFIYNLPKDIVSGDFYWVGESNGVKIAALADCTGHGVPGGFMSMIGHMLLNEIILSEGITSPSEILTRMDARVIDTLRQHRANKQAVDGMDMIICAYDEVKNELKFGGALASLFYEQGGKLDLAHGTIREIGGNMKRRRTPDFGEITIPIKERTRLYLMTDGILDQFGGPEGKKLNIGGVRKLLEGIADKPFNTLQASFQNLYENWKQSEPQLDDICIVGIELNPPT